MKKRIISILLLIAVIFSFELAGAYSNQSYAAKTVNKYDEQIDDLKDELEDVNSLLGDSKHEAVVLSKEIDQIEKDIKDLNSKISSTSKKITDTTKKLESKQKEMSNRTDDLEDRLVVMYKNGSIGFLDVIFGSRGISELVSNLKMLQRIVKNDQKVLETLEGESLELTEIKTELKAEKDELSAAKTTLNSKMSTLNKKKSALNDQIKKLEKEQKEINDEIARLTDLSKAYVGGDLQFPLPEKYHTKSRVTSVFGYRIHPIYKERMLHTGIDLGCPKGTKIYAAQAGKVILSKYYGNFGETVMIDHGGGIVTLYAHCSKRLVSVGQTVKAGDNIALVGMTGGATGNHLHFEIRENNTPVDPVKYFPELKK